MACMLRVRDAMVGRSEYEAERNRARRFEADGLSLLLRLERLSWLRVQICRYPGGFVPVATAARVLGVRRHRVHELIRLGRLPATEPMPGGSGADRFVPIDALISAPCRLDSGFQRVFPRAKGSGRAGRARPNPYADALPTPQSAVDAKKTCACTVCDAKSMPDNGLGPDIVRVR